LGKVPAGKIIEMIDSQTVIKNIPNAVTGISTTGLGPKKSGKVRDWFVKDNLRFLVATDRISAFDRVLGHIPFRGAVLNKLSAFWFEKTNDIVQNHMIGIINPYIMLVAECDPLPVEVIVRGYITGVTDTSLWKKYSDGDRVIYGIKFPNGLVKNQKLPKPVITPTTKAATGHDQPITAKEIVTKKLVSAAIWKQIEKAAVELFERGSQVAEKGGLILADTKYEFGLDKKGKLVLIDEIHTPDSSRFWLKSTYKERFKKGEEVENYDKEIMRIWFKEHGYSGDGKAPKMSSDIIAKVAQRYMEVYEMLTGEKFTIDLSYPPKKSIDDTLSKLT
jgi:phosphoribosylaminoimidazole-succinocarboxamide synthase